MRRLLGFIAATALIISQAIAQQSAGQPSDAAPAVIVGRTAVTIAAEGQRMGKLQRYQDDPNLIAEYEYYFWRNGCYLRQSSGDFVSVPIESCR
jgi:hypothetical protein